MGALTGVATRVFSYTKAPVPALVVALVLVGILGLQEFFLAHHLTCLGMMLLPVVARIGQNRQSVRFTLPALLFAGASFFLPVTTLAYAGWLCCLFLLVESQWGKLNYLPLLTAAVVSPIFNFVINIFGFGLRLQLSRLSAKVLSVAGPATAEGNLILFRGEEFSVDPACMGLLLTETALLIGIVLLAWQEKLQNRQLPLFMVLISLGLIFLLVIVANLLRILLLVYLNLPPGTVMHEIMGLLTLLVYVAIPGYFLVNWLAKKWPISAAKPNTRTGRKKLAVPVMLTGAILLVLLKPVFYPNVAIQHEPVKRELAGVQVNYLPANVVKLQSPQSLIYLKAGNSFYSADHNPAICWTGSGYEFKKVKETVHNGQPLFQAQLIRKTDVLYTAWWYQNGKHSTTSQLDWRLRMLKGEPGFYLVNVTAESPELLKKAIQELKQEKWAEKLMD